MADPRLTAVVHDLGVSLIRQVESAVDTVWNNLPDLTDEAGDQAVAQVVPIVGGAQNVTAALHANYVSQVVGMVVSTPEVATLIDRAQWNRSPLIQARRLVGEGFTLEEARAQAAARAAQVHSGDVLRARRDATDALGYGVETTRPVRWAKVPQPDACSWCRLVSTRLYRRSDGLPAHLNDRCGLNAVTPLEDISAYTNASTIFGQGDGRWRQRVQTSEVREVQRRVAERASELATAAYRSMAEPIAA